MSVIRINRKFCLKLQLNNVSRWLCGKGSVTRAVDRTNLATCALVIEGAESDRREEDGNVEEDGRGHVLQEGFITADYTWGGVGGGRQTCVTITSSGSR